ncbi:unnamed protein product [Kuraishia capsulata CBS 1993]|uniref:DUF2433 domain-containing protein n=1 Tax=Kuraishia capsulata CBS 1993 TaxID=1382522 RepID=W6MMA5_9ASCO|nr:uncharacterized protein KUCA_T00003311001 [Kuraishia capsulata CBS 1993]CDK27333.1 unnamed protein product [Kuraishia capsulata CBS 1993]
MASTAASSQPFMVQKNNLRILFIADIRGELSKLNILASEYNADLIVHTGNFGFLDEGSVMRIHESYLRHIVEFSPLLSEDLIIKISKLSKVTGDNVEHFSSDNENLKSLLRDQQISELHKLLSRELKLDVPVYTIYGMCEDSLVINKFKHDVYTVPNLFILDDSTFHTVRAKSGETILLAGLGGSLSYHKLFHQGTQFDPKEIREDGILKPGVVDVSGDPGNLWITILQLGRLIQTLSDYSTRYPEAYEKAIKIFITHQSPTREPLLEHLSIFFKMDYTISNSLHFKYTSSYNELSINPSFEAFKIKFNEARTKLACIWKNIQQKYEELLFKSEDPNLLAYLELALEVFDKIPVSTKGAGEILPLALVRPDYDSDADIGNGKSGATGPKSKELISIIRQLNDLYYIAFQNSWHFNLCDLHYGTLVLGLSKGEVAMQCHSKGFDFGYRYASDEFHDDDEGKIHANPKPVRGGRASRGGPPRGGPRGRGSRGGYRGSRD